MKLWPLWIPYPVSILRAAFVLGIFMAIASPFILPLSISLDQARTVEEAIDVAIIFTDMKSGRNNGSDRAS